MGSKEEKRLAKGTGLPNQKRVKSTEELQPNALLPEAHVERQDRKQQQQYAKTDTDETHRALYTQGR